MNLAELDSLGERGEHGVGHRDRDVVHHPGVRRVAEVDHPRHVLENDETGMHTPCVWCAMTFRKSTVLIEYGRGGQKKKRKRK